MYLVLENITKDHQSLVATIVHTIQGVRTFASQIEHSLRIDVNQFQLSRRHGVFHGVRVLELSQADGQRIILSHAIIGIELLWNTREVVHKEKRPAVCDTCFCPKERTLQIVGVGLLTIEVLIRPAALCIAIQGDTTGKVLHPKGSVFLLLSHSSRTAKNGQHYG